MLKFVVVSGAMATVTGTSVPNQDGLLLYSMATLAMTGTRIDGVTVV